MFQPRIAMPVLSMMPEPKGEAALDPITLLVTEEPGMELLRRIPTNQKPGGQLGEFWMIQLPSMIPVPGAGDWCIPLNTTPASSPQKPAVRMMVLRVTILFDQSLS